MDASFFRKRFLVRLGNFISVSGAVIVYYYFRGTNGFNDITGHGFCRVSTVVPIWGWYDVSGSSVFIFTIVYFLQRIDGNII